MNSKDTEEKKFDLELVFDCFYLLDLEKINKSLNISNIEMNDYLVYFNAWLYFNKVFERKQKLTSVKIYNFNSLSYSYQLDFINHVMLLMRDWDIHFFFTA